MDPAAIDVRALLSQAILALLKSQACPAPELPPRRALQERAAAGEAAAARALRLVDELDRLPRRVEQALLLENADVLLADGSRLPLEDAERLLAVKEERRPHTALRGSIRAALAPIRQFEHCRSDAATRALASQFLVATTGLRDAAREALASLGGGGTGGSSSGSAGGSSGSSGGGAGGSAHVLLENPDALAWALDLPDANGAFGEERTKALIASARAAAAAAQGGAQAGGTATAFRAPRAMAGVALRAGASAGSHARYAWPSLRRCDRHMRTLEAAGTALTWSVVPGGVAGAAGAADIAFGVAAGLALTSTAVRRAIGVDRREAERASRICAATFVLRARASFALASLSTPSAEQAHAAPDEEAAEQIEDEARTAMIAALGADPGRALLAELASASLPWVSVEDHERSRALLRAPQCALRMRDDFDEAWVLRREAWQSMVEVVPATPARPDDKEIAALTSAWQTWAGEWL